MAIRRIAPLVMIVALAGCGQTPYQSPLDDVRDDYGYGTDQFTPSPTPTDDGVARPDTTASASPDSAVGSFTLKGRVTKKDSGQAIQGAVVSIGAASVVTGSDGRYTISDIRDTKVTVEVEMDGYADLTGYEVSFSGTSETVEKNFQLTATDEDEDEDEQGFKAELTVGEGQFKSVSALATHEGHVYVLGKADGFLFLNFQSLGVYNGADGTELKLTRDIDSLFKRLPKTATRLAVVDGQVLAATETDAYVYSAAGEFIKKQAVGSQTFPNAQTVVEDEDRDLKYSIEGAKVKVVSDDETKSYSLPGVSSPVMLALDADERLWVLDGLTKTARKFKFTP